MASDENGGPNADTGNSPSRRVLEKPTVDVKEVRRLGLVGSQVWLQTQSCLSLQLLINENFSAHHKLPVTRADWEVGHQGPEERASYSDHEGNSLSIHKLCKEWPVEKCVWGPTWFLPVMAAAVTDAMVVTTCAVPLVTSPMVVATLVAPATVESGASVVLASLILQVSRQPPPLLCSLSFFAHLNQQKAWISQLRRYLLSGPLVGKYYPSYLDIHMAYRYCNLRILDIYICCDA